MKKSMMFVTVVFVAMMAFVGCANPVIPTPDPDPVKVYLDDASMVSFTRVDAAGTLAYADIYQWDNDADGTVDTGMFVDVSGTETVVSPFTFNAEWTIMVGGNVYLNNANIGPLWVHAADATMNFHFVKNGDEVEIDFVDLLADDLFWSELVFTYTDFNTITSSGHTWTR